MRSSIKRLMAVLLAAAMVCALAACGGGSSKDGGGSSDGANVIKIGGTGPLTGGASIYGISVKQGAEIAVEEINAANPDLQIEFKMEDDEADGEKSVNAYNKLKDWGVQMIMGSVTSGSCITVAAETNSDRVFLMTPSASSADVTTGKDNAFQICFTDPTQGVKAAENIAKDFADKKIGVIYHNSDP